MSVRIVDVDGARIAVREWGSADGRPIFFWHALGPAASGATIGEVAPVLAARGYRVAAVDGPGFGASEPLPPERYELAPLIALVGGLLDELAWERPVLMGHSWGGALAVHAAARRPVSALVLLDSGHIDYSALPDVNPDEPWDVWLETARQRQTEWTDRFAFEQDLRDGTARWSPELLECFVPGVREVDGRLVGAPAEVRAAAMRGLARTNASDAWPALADVPTLLLLATTDPWGSQNRELTPRFEAAVPHAEIRWVEGAGHAIPADRGPALGDEIADWLDRNV